MKQQSVAIRDYLIRKHSMTVGDLYNLYRWALDSPIIRIRRELEEHFKALK